MTPATRAATRRHAGGRTRGAHLVAALVGVLLGGAAVTLTGGDDETVTTVADGTVEVTATEGDLQVTLTGPESVTAGQTATFRAEASGQDGVAWITPEGAVVAGTTILEVATSSAGGATVTVVATAAGGREVRATHRLAVVEATAG